ncbi:tetrahydromethanopterin S-methyltransferase subunit C [Alkalibacillus flavidus]|uniref:Tetrahydromethanopterin S-methyltransferase subunit C n=1 Tax=Alkalibacillus flavidus TaxID=546021 RepID=A0ABV2KUQ4_9BACI
MTYQVLIGVLIGFTSVAIIQGLWTGTFNWTQWSGMIVGGMIAFVIVYVVERRVKNK